MKPGARVEVCFAVPSGVRHEPGVVREVRAQRFDTEAIRSVVVALDNGHLCVANPSSVRAVVVESQS